MCGIVGAISCSPVDPQRIAQMRDRLVHRGPDAAGLWSSPEGHVCLGFRRLAIVDLTPDANQPFVSHDGRFVIVFNGEIYNFQSLSKELAKEGVRFRTRSDTEVLLEAYRHWGADCLRRLTGMFAFALWDTREQRLFCARDRAGEKPFYYTHVNGSFVFASELKSLLLWPGFRRQIHYPALVDFLTLGFVADPKSIWEGCYKLPPAHFLSVEVSPDGQPAPQAPRSYWDLEFRPDPSVSDWTPRILGTLQEASREMSFADVPVGAFLSGGVDSSSVTAALSKAGCAVSTFTVGFDDSEYDERSWARQVASLYHTRHHERLVAPCDVNAVFQQLLWHYDEPFNDFSYLPTYYVCREARQAITVALSGDGGDELFGGYQKYQRVQLRRRVQPMLPRPVGALLAAGARAVLPDGPTRGKLLNYTSDTSTFLLDSFTLAFPVPTLSRSARGPLAHALRHYHPQDLINALLSKAPLREVGLLNAMRYLDLKLTLAGDILVKVDRASMAVSLEVRPVYLHRDLMELAAQIPPSCLADRGTAKKVLKDALRAWLPQPLLYRKKQGFAMPLKKWLAGDLKHLLGRAADSGPLAEVLDPELLQQTREHSPSGRDPTLRLHSIILLQHWLAKWA